MDRHVEQRAFIFAKDPVGVVAIDGNEIVARNNGGQSQLNLNTRGGNVSIGSSGSQVKVFGTFVNSSSRHVKDDFAEIDTEKVSENLGRVDKLVNVAKGMQKRGEQSQGSWRQGDHIVWLLGETV